MKPLIEMLKFNPIKKLVSIFGSPTPTTLDHVSAPDSFQKDMLEPDTAQGQYDQFKTMMQSANDRLLRYKEYELMDDGMAAAVLFIWTENATQLRINDGKSLWVTSENLEIETIVNQLFVNLDIESRLQGITRDIAKYGDVFMAVIQQRKEDGLPGKVIDIKNIPPAGIVPVEDTMGRVLGYLRGSDDSECVLGVGSSRPVDMDMPWDFVHFKFGGMSGDNSFGTSVFWGATRDYKKLLMMEEAVLITRLKRSPDRLKWEVEVGGLSDDKAQIAVNKFKNNLVKKQVVDRVTGEMRQEYNPWSMDKDIYIPVRNGAGHKVELMQGSSTVGDIVDLDYMRKKVCGIFRVPSDYLGFDDADGGFLASSPLAYQDVRFAAGVERLQKAVLRGLMRIVQLNLVWLGIDPLLEKNDFSLHMTPVSFLAEQQKADVLKVRAETVEILSDLGKSLGLTAEEQKQLIISGLPSDLSSQLGFNKKEKNTESFKRVCGKLDESQRRKYESVLKGYESTVRRVREEAQEWEVRQGRGALKSSDVLSENHREGLLPFYDTRVEVLEEYVEDLEKSLEKGLELTEEEEKGEITLGEKRVKVLSCMEKLGSLSESLHKEDMIRKSILIEEVEDE